MFEEIGSIIVFNDFLEWKEKADKIGSIRVDEDGYIVCDVGEYCGGEFGDGVGWVVKESFD